MTLNDVKTKKLTSQTLSDHRYQSNSLQKLVKSEIVVIYSSNNGDFIAFCIKTAIFDVTIDVYHQNIKMIGKKIPFLKILIKFPKRQVTIDYVLDKYYGLKTTKCPNFMVKMTKMTKTDVFLTSYDYEIDI